MRSRRLVFALAVAALGVGCGSSAPVAAAYPSPAVADRPGRRSRSAPGTPISPTAVHDGAVSPAAQHSHGRVERDHAERAGDDDPPLIARAIGIITSYAHRD